MLSAFSVAALLVVALQHPAPPPAVEIRGPNDAVLVTADQIVSYDGATHTLTLRKGTGDRLRADLKAAGYEETFEIVVGGKAVYSGAFKSAFSSQSHAGVVIVVDLNLDTDDGKDRLTIQLGYPSAKQFQGKDPRDDGRLVAALKAAGKLK